MTVEFKAMNDLPPRDEFDDEEAYCRILHEGGYQLTDSSGRPRYLPAGDGYYASLLRGIHPMRQRRPRRRSIALSAEEYMTLYKAVAFANLKGQVLNCFTSISWSLQGLPDDDAIKRAHQEFLERYREWCRRRNLPHALIWVLERGRTFGLHSHLLHHLPDEEIRIFKVWADKRIAKITRKPIVRPNTTTGSKLNTLLVEQVRDGTKGQWAVLKYMTKGLSDVELVRILKRFRSSQLLDQFGRDIGKQGAVDGRRASACFELHSRAQEEFFAQDDLPWPGKPPCWPQKDLAPQELEAGDVFLRAGELIRQVRSLDV